MVLLPFALLRARNTPYLQGLTPYEIMFGRPPPLCPRLKADLLAEVTNQDVLKSLQALQRDQDRLFPLIRHVHSLPPVDPHPFQPGDPVWVKRHHKETLEPGWKEPFTVILTTPTAVKVDVLKPWIHHSQLKLAVREQKTTTQWRVKRDN